MKAIVSDCCYINIDKETVFCPCCKQVCLAIEIEEKIIEQPNKSKGKTPTSPEIYSALKKKNKNK